MIRQELPGGHHLLTGALPDELRLGEGEFETLWHRHPDEYHQVRTPRGQRVPTPRWQQAYDRDYVYTGSKNNALPLSVLTDGIPKLSRIVRWCQSEIDGRLNGVLVNWYDGSRGHYIGKHRDSRKGLILGTPIVTLSFGETRTFRLRPYKGDAQRLDFDAPDGTVFVLPFETNLAHG